MSLRTFDHEEFYAWFTAYALKDRLVRLHEEGEVVSHDLLSVAQLSDATASYVCAVIERTPDQVRSIVAGLTDLVRREWRATYLQHNAGTLIAYLISGVQFTPPLVINAEAVYSSVVFETSRLTGVHIRNGSFVSATFAGASWHGVVLEGCDLGEPTLSSIACYEDVEFRDCKIGGIRVIRKDGEEIREYAPDRVVSRLAKLGINEVSSKEPAISADAGSTPSEGETRKLAKRLLNVFRRTTFLSENTIKNRFPRDHKKILEEVLPLMERHGLVQPKPWKGSGKQLAWGLSASLERIEKADGEPRGPLGMFWTEVDETDRR